MNENQSDPISGVMRHIRRLYVFLALLASAFVVLAALVWWRSPHEILLAELRKVSLDMAQRPIPVDEQAELKREREQKLEDRIADAKAIVLCEDTRSWGRPMCKVTRILKQEPGFHLPYSVGNPIPDHVQRESRDMPPHDGMITFLTGSSFFPSSSLVINNGRVTDAYVDPSRPSYDPYVTREFTVEQVIEMIGTANKVPEDTARKLADPQH